ncbi:lamin tail domain-containing protein, partial [Microbacteriaceae bacterium]|nr:lamin tail domain-containing protein [Candidatus Saccharibacteria bacterium]
DNIQHIVPDGYELENGACVLTFVAKKIVLSELLANPEGVDAGHEYVEIYNASDETANLADYSLQFSGKSYHFPNGKLLLPHTFMSFSDDDLDVTFPNTVGVEIKIVSKDGTITSVMPAYSNAPASQSWSKIGEAWAYTNMPTRDSDNRPSIVTDIDSEVAAVRATYAQCAVNQYRSPETNRCRLIATNATTLAPCKDGQYRSEETNRCRSILQAVAASLKPCNDDQFRNPSSGRCKKIASTDDFLQPCDAGWERNVDTNRCRKIKATSMPVAAFPVQAIAPTTNTVSTWIVAGAVVAGALCYAVWEWRYEASAMLKRIFKR